MADQESWARPEDDSELDAVDDSDESSEDESQDDSEENKGERSDDDVLAEALTRFKLAEEAESTNRVAALEDMQFAAGDQWPQQIKNERDADSRPCLTINRLPQFIQQVTNDQRQNRPAIKVHPVDDQSDPKTAKTLQGIIRHIEYNSNADTAYDTAFEGAVTGGFGFYRFITKYVDPLSFDQEIYFKRIRNPMSVFFDPNSQEPDGSDAEWGGIVEDISKDEYERTWPKSKMGGDSEGWANLGNAVPGWIGEKTVRVAEYFCKEYRPGTICLLSNGQVVEKSQLPAYLDALAQKAQMESQASAPGEPVQVDVQVKIVSERETMIPKVRWYKLSAGEVLEKTDWLGKYIPIVPVYGLERFINGKRTLEGIVRNAKDPQRMLNYWKSAETEAIALAPRAPFIAAEGQIEKFKGEWETANRRNHAVLTYTPKSVDGMQVPPPQRNAIEPAVQAITQAAMMSADDLKATTGIYDSALGARSNESSGVAIQRRNVQAQTSNYHFTDNLTRSLRHAGRILVDLIPKVYDTARIVRIIGEDGTQDRVMVNQPYKDPKTNQEAFFPLGIGLYDVTVDVGPSFASKRQEAVASMLDLTRSFPQLAQVAGDLMVKNMDWPGAEEIATRLKKTLPPNLADDQKGNQVPPQIQAQMAQMGQMIDGLTKQLNEANQKLETKTIELESKERIALMQIQKDLQIEHMKSEAKDAQILFAAELAQINRRLDQLGFHELIDPNSQQDFAPPAPGGMPAGDPGANTPTGGQSPGSPMETP